MKSVLLSLLASFAMISAASAADAIMAPQPAPVAPMAVPFSWSGGYAGIRGGGVWINGDFSIPGATASENFNGGLVGGFVGYNWQFQNNIVVGVEGDLNYNWDENTYDVFGTDVEVGTDVSGSARVRLGYAIDHALVYATGGWAAARGYIEGAGDKETETFNGWTAGAGVDYAFTDKIFGRVEYRYTDYQDKDIIGINTDLDQNEVTAGIGVKF